MKKVLCFIIIIGSLLLTTYGKASAAHTVEMLPKADMKTALCYVSKVQSSPDFRSILAANAIHCPPASSLIISQNLSFATPFPPYTVLTRHTENLEKAQWNIHADLKFVPNDIVQAHYYIFALRRIII
ncbi:MAG TPA: hypothetical protein PLJ40_04290 [Paludibacteraceae bacterium]|jgi:hypothetical protein|nr:hypothetical protein [Paludibacteraceae bacterium]HQB69546.1 hypothetical protein [Paludibacteraceae bacterium]HRS68298.1 hypothetical protein [Paludibacteraceae bacterium]